MNSIYMLIFKAIAPVVVSLLKAEAAKTKTEVDDKLVAVLENILKEFKILS